MNKANYELSNVKAELERTKLRNENMIRERDTQIIIEQKKSEDLLKDRKFLFEKQQAQSTDLLTIQDEYANYKVFKLVGGQQLMVVGSGSNDEKFEKRKQLDEGYSHRKGRTTK